MADPTGTRYFTTPTTFPTHSDAEYLQAARDIASRCWCHYEDRHDEGTGTLPSFGTLYTGAIGSCSYLRLRLAEVESEAASSEGASAAGCSKDLLSKGLRAADAALRQAARRSKRCTLLECPTTSALSMKCATLAAMKRSADASAVANDILRLGQSCRSPVESLDESECEILYGRAGYLTSILFVRKYLGDVTFGQPVVKNIIRTIIETGISTARAYQTNLPLLWEWHGSLYLGAAHGVVGILFTLLCLAEELKQVGEDMGRDLLALVHQTINILDREQTFASGNLRSSIGREKDKLVHWCHGAPGYVLLLVKAYDVFHETRYLRRAEHICKNVIYPRGLLRKGVGLCHGVSGNAYSFLAVYRGRLLEQQRAGRVGGGETSCTKPSEVAEENNRYVHMAKSFASFAIENLAVLERVPDRPYSLYEGMAGLAALLIDLQTPMVRNAKFPCFEF
mmetsp:Transcript_25961/g.56267  ORF Transcript_25961/g.56267 Transcript_25961/m.56267 type:complete len:452 (-) Transcript_25961:2-1357(-)